MLAFISFIMFSPAAKEALFGGFTDFESVLNEQIAPFHTYPVETTYSLEREIALQNTGATGYLLETVPIPFNVKSLHGSDTMYTSDDGQGDRPSQDLQVVNSVVVSIDGETISIPINGDIRERSSAYTTNSGHEIWWPSLGNGDDFCKFGPCMKIRVVMPQGSSTTFSVISEVTSTSYSWWDSPRVNALVEGSQLEQAMTAVETSLTFLRELPAGIASDTQTSCGMTEVVKVDGQLMLNMQRFYPSLETLMQIFQRGKKKMPMHSQEQLSTIFMQMFDTTLKLM